MLAEINRFINWVRRRSPHAHTWQDYRSDLKLFLEAVGDQPPAAITFREVDRFIDCQVAQGFTPGTINRRLASVSALYVFLMPEDPGLVSPVLPQRHALRQPERLPRPVQDTDLRRFFAVIDDPRDLAIFTLMLRGGLRIAEAASLQLSDLYLEEALPRIVVTGKGSRQRPVYLSPQALRALRRYLAVRPAAACDFVFLSYQGRGLSTHAIQMRMQHYRQIAGLKLTCHRLRHTFANDLLNARTPITSIQVLMGHCRLETTRIYVQANDQMVQDDFAAACRNLEGWS